MGSFDGKTKEDLRILRIAKFSIVIFSNQGKGLASMRYGLANVLRDTGQTGVVAALLFPSCFTGQPHRHYKVVLRTKFTVSH